MKFELIFLGDLRIVNTPRQNIGMYVYTYYTHMHDPDAGRCEWRACSLQANAEV